MTKIQDQLKQAIFDAVKTAYPEVEVKLEEIILDHPTVEEFGDYSTNLPLRLSKQLNKNPQEVADKIIAEMSSPVAAVAKAGFINFTLTLEFLISEMTKVGKNFGENQLLAGQKIMVEYAHPNTHKEMHIGHMRTLITGEALARIFTACGAMVYRANYQGDIGPHVAKAVWGADKLLKNKGLTWEEIEKKSLPEKAHFLGEGYVSGVSGYEENKAAIDELNSKLYASDPTISEIYKKTRQWSLDYYDSLYQRFNTKFDHLYFESEVAQAGKKIVMDNVGKVFTKSDGAIIFDGEKYGLHKRVFITTDGNPTYEAKDMGLAPAQFSDFPFDKCIHVVANEQAGYFKVIIKALELIDAKYIGREHHLSMGMVQLVGKKMSSRTGILITVDGLIDDVKNLLPNKGTPEAVEPVAIGAVKYSVLKTDPLLNAMFDLEKSVSLDGDSGPYLQYTYARSCSVIAKSNATKRSLKDRHAPLAMTPEEIKLLRYLYRFPEVVEQAAKQYAPNVLCTYLFELAKRFNNFYNNCQIISDDKNLTANRLLLTASVSQIIANGLNLLGIEALEKM
ncbi:arginine--tRNA ligase [Candidatus Gottesmanbacteria bacterium RIFCSPHIGHO2_01_FULL_42_12]|uniref:Arginine--tRNA ligase n=1 Tax=Candidatus Gottesmanbacteria bacterium RIFCSPHIGHO2_01_FULL_42_12 TaxID=1798377 RepID=A0A1F5Z5M2_9BACT|nr:MAG: arginine--tRNA ligase [Candidatus Gottesmanbacteria bacterium RIFCSPHIGHO2_01_FULL_42_12]